MERALIVDDDRDFTRMMAALVSRHGFETVTAQSLRAARRQIALGAPDLLLVDLYLPDGQGLSLLDDDALGERTQVILITGNASLETSIQALRRGAADYLVKPVSMPRLESILARAMRPRDPPVDIHAELARTGRFGSLVGRSGRMELVYEQIARVTRTSMPVFFSGETGTGKSLAARLVHDFGPRRDAPFIEFNCGGWSAQDLEGELFGDAARPGAIRRAATGTLFLDEVCSLPPSAQARLLASIESGALQQPRDGTGVRLISATSRQPSAAVAQGLLREDLLYRLRVFPIEMPPLRDRMEDLTLLAAYLLREIGRRDGNFKRATPGALQRLAQYRWPGNVRELRNALEQSHAMTVGGEIKHSWLPRDEAAPAVRPDTPSLTLSAGMSLAQVEREVILATLERFGGRRDRAALELGISPKTLYTRLKHYGR
jgi:two-component system response regulator AtoC